MAPFEKFKPETIKSDLKVIIFTDGQFCLNQTTYNSYFKDYPEVIFYFDSDAGKIGIKPSRRKTESSFSLRVNETPGGGQVALINGWTFLEFYRIEYRERPASYAVRWNERQGLLEFALNTIQLRNVKQKGYHARFKNIRS